MRIDETPSSNTLLFVYRKIINANEIKLETKNTNIKYVINKTAKKKEGIRRKEEEKKNWKDYTTNNVGSGYVSYHVLYGRKRYVKNFTYGIYYMNG